MWRCNMRVTIETPSECLEPKGKVHIIVKYCIFNGKACKHTSHNCTFVELQYLQNKEVYFESSFCDAVRYTSPSPPVSCWENIFIFLCFRVSYDCSNSTRWQYLMIKWYWCLMTAKIWSNLGILATLKKFLLLSLSLSLY